MRIIINIPKVKTRKKLKEILFSEITLTLIILNTLVPLILYFKTKEELLIVIGILNIIWLYLLNCLKMDISRKWYKELRRRKEVHKC